MTALRWTKCTMLAAMNWARTREATADRAENLPEDGYSASAVVFTDGSAIACESNWSGPYSEVTPDVDAEPPTFWIGDRPSASSVRLDDTAAGETR